MDKNAICWFEIAVRDLEKTIAFYQKVMDVKLNMMEEAGFTMAVFPHEENSTKVSGCLYEDKNATANNSNILIYFDVEGRIKDAVKAVRENGGSVDKDVESIGPWGYRAVVCDCEGNKVALYSRTA